MSKLYILLLPFFVFSQTKTFSVYDFQTKNELNEAKVLYNNQYIKPKKTKFEITKKSAENIVVSHIGYQTKNFDFNQIADTIFLLKDNENLNEVTINNKFTKIKLKPKVGIHSLYPDTFGTGAPMQCEDKIGMFFPNKSTDSCFITKIYLKPLDYVWWDYNKSKSNTTKDTKYAPFKVNLYTVIDSIGIPNEKILDEDIVANLERNEKWVVLKFNKVYFPKNGIFIVIEGLTKEEYNKLGFKRPPPFDDFGTSEKCEFKCFYFSKYKGYWDRDKEKWESFQAYNFALEVVTQKKLKNSIND